MEYVSFPFSSVTRYDDKAIKKKKEFVFQWQFFLLGAVSEPLEVMQPEIPRALAGCRTLSRWRLLNDTLLEDFHFLTDHRVSNKSPHSIEVGLKFFAPVSVQNFLFLGF